MINMPRADWLTVTRKLGLASSLFMSHDYGHEGCYSGSGQTITDLAGNANFNLGSGSGAAADDATFNGTAGRRSSGEYFSFDGADILSINGANPARIENLHKDNAILTAILALYVNTTTAAQGLLSTCRGNNAQIGFHWQLTSLGKLGAGVRTGTSNALNVGNTAVVVEPGWNILGISLDEASGNGNFLCNGVIESFTSTYTSPSASSATAGLRIGSRNDQDLLESGSRVAACNIWEGTGGALTADQMRAFFQAVRGRWGI